mmetsp:Transcript_70492/g.229220  ORF Transcript_70492/g.229220 Transcript_70492/m.229220 type:complete len:126 (-) Transcript_70492:110-487(-)
MQVLYCRRALGCFIMFDVGSILLLAFNMSMSWLQVTLSTLFFVGPLCGAAAARRLQKPAATAYLVISVAKLVYLLFVILHFHRYWISALAVFQLLIIWRAYRLWSAMRPLTADHLQMLVDERFVL